MLIEAVKSWLSDNDSSWLQIPAGIEEAKIIANTLGLEVKQEGIEVIFIRKGLHIINE
jgi:hypothetical protein